MPLFPEDLLSGKSAVTKFTQKNALAQL